MFVIKIYSLFEFKDTPLQNLHPGFAILKTPAQMINYLIFQSFLNEFFIIDVNEPLRDVIDINKRD